MSINVEILGGSLMVQHYIEEIGELFYQIAHPPELRRQIHHQIEVYEERGRVALTPHR